MTLEEFSNQFDTLVSSYRRFKDFDKREMLDSIEFDEYEKSVWLTKSQEELVISLYNGKNPFGDSFESTEEQRRYLSNLVVEDTIYPITNTSGRPIGMDETNSYFFSIPSEEKPSLWFITYEDVTVSSNACKKEGKLDVYPVTQDEYLKVKKNPFRGANGRRALRLDLADGVIEIVCKYPVTKYYIRYIRKPNPIVLEDLPNGLTVENVGTESPCELHEALHQRILERAVRMALQSKGLKMDE